MPARPAVLIRIVTTERQRIVHAEFDPALDDLRLCELNQRGVDADAPALHAHLRGKIRHGL